jgi:hypothetical protein
MPVRRTEEMWNLKCDVGVCDIEARCLTILLARSRAAIQLLLTFLNINRDKRGWGISSAREGLRVIS